MSDELKREVIDALKELREALKPKAVVFDLDGVLVDCSERYARCREESRGDRGRFWKCFLSEKYMDLDKPREDAVKLLRSYLAKGYRIIILTGRVRQAQARKTREQLRRWRIYYHEIVFRERGDYREDRIFKLEELEKLMKKYRVKAVFDESEEIVEAIKKHYPKVEARKI